MTNPIEELNERLEATKRLRQSVEHQAVPPWIDRYHEMENLAEQFKSLAECYREQAYAGVSNAYPSEEKWRLVDEEASELFQGRTK